MNHALWPNCIYVINKKFVNFMNFYRENKENFILFVVDKKGQALNL